MTEETIYMAEDGTQFDSKTDCANYEAEVKLATQIADELDSCLDLPRNELRMHRHDWCKVIMKILLKYNIIAK